MAKILITGGAGYIGSHTALELLNEGYEVVVYDNLCNSSQESLRRVEELTGKTVKFYEGDVLDGAALEAMFRAENVDAVIHCAALKAVGESVQKPLEYYQNNITGTLTLMDVMNREYRVQFFRYRLRKPGGDADHRKLPEGTVHQSLRMDQIYDGADHVRCSEGKSGLERDPSAVLQSGRGTQERTYRRGSEGNPEQPDAVYFSGGSRKAREAGRFRK